MSSLILKFNRTTFAALALYQREAKFISKFRQNFSLQNVKFGSNITNSNTTPDSHLA
ncbi:hypothetical protein [Campylobacter concisus]